MRTRSEIKKSVEAVKVHTNYIEIMYSKKYEEWNGYFQDDRQLYCNLYRQIFEMYEDYKFCKSSSTKVAINKQFRKDEETMKEIIERFK